MCNSEIENIKYNNNIFSWAARMVKNIHLLMQNKEELYVIKMKRLELFTSRFYMFLAISIIVIFTIAGSIFVPKLNSLNKRIETIQVNCKKHYYNCNS